MLEKLEATGFPEAVRGGNEPKAAWTVGRTPPETLRTAVIVDGDAHPGEGGEVVRRAAGSSEVKVNKSDGLAVSEDDILQTDIVVADH